MVRNLAVFEAVVGDIGCSEITPTRGNTNWIEADSII